jgi:hypothetical protein
MVYISLTMEMSHFGCRAAKSPYSAEPHNRAVRMVAEVCPDHPAE